MLARRRSRAPRRRSPLLTCPEPGHQQSAENDRGSEGDESSGQWGTIDEDRDYPDECFRETHCARSQVGVYGGKFEGRSEIAESMQIAPLPETIPSIESLRVGDGWFVFQERDVFPDREIVFFVVNEVEDGLVTYQWQVEVPSPD